MVWVWRECRARLQTDSRLGRWAKGPRMSDERAMSGRMASGVWASEQASTSSLPSPLSAQPPTCEKLDSARLSTHRDHAIEDAYVHLELNPLRIQA